VLKLTFPQIELKLNENKQIQASQPNIWKSEANQSALNKERKLNSKLVEA